MENRMPLDILNSHLITASKSANKDSKGSLIRFFALNRTIGLKT